MKTISSVVEHYIKTKPFLLSALSQGIINLTSLARNMMPELEQELGKDVKQGAIVMALKRLSEDLDFRLNHRILKVLKNLGEITVLGQQTRGVAPPFYVPDITSASNSLGLSIKVPVERAVAKTVEWYLHQSKQYRLV